MGGVIFAVTYGESALLATAGLLATNAITGMLPLNAASKAAPTEGSLLAT